jgi:hypothetical protein
MTLDIPVGMKHHELPTSKGTIEFWGRLIDETDTDNGDRQRWAELRLYKILDTNPEHDEHAFGEDQDMFGKEMWLVYTIGHTLVYHEMGSPCNRGIEASVAEFPSKTADFPEGPDDPDLEPCEECRPLDYHEADDEDLYELEVTWYRHIPCQSAEKVIRSLYREPRCEACRHKPHETRRCRCSCTRYVESTPMLSIPGSRLISKVKSKDPEIARAAAVKTKL